MDRLLDWCRGSLIGGAAGDALGYEVEFSSRKEIIRRFGDGGIKEYSLDREGRARFSDDTQMTLFTAEGVLTAAAKGEAEDPVTVLKEIEKSYISWYATQTAFQLPMPGSWLSNIRDLWSRRAPGNTCLTALRQLKEGRVVKNDSKGCGGVMRVAPIGIYYGANPLPGTDEERLVAEIAGGSAEITHHNDMSTFASALAALVIFKCIREQEVSRAKLREIVVDSMPLVLDLWPESKAAKKFGELINEAMDLAESEVGDFEAILKLGEGWVAEETIAIALYCVMRYIDDFGKCLICAVNHDGDSDSTGSLAGNIIGAIVGYDAIPEKFKTHLELHDVIISIADDLAGASSPEQLDSRYIHHKPFGVPENLTIFSNMKFTPENITELAPDEIFVFGSNLAGCHAGGAARIARQRFGAIEGQGIGLQGQSYAIPTMQGGVETIKPYVDEFLDVAEECDQTTFLVTRIGCGIAGFTDEEIAPLFRRALSMYNVRLPESFVRILLADRKEG